MTYGVFQLYVSHAQNIISKHEKARTVSKISRERIELQILTCLDESSMPIQFKISWADAILSSSHFEAFWIATRSRLHLSSQSTTRYVPDKTLLESPHLHLDSDDSNSIASAETSTYHHLTAGTPDTSVVRGSSPGARSVTSSAAAFARMLGGGVDSPSQIVADPRGLLADPNGLLREEGDDGEYGRRDRKSLSSSAAKNRKTAAKKPRAPAKPRVKGTPRPKGEAKARVQKVKGKEPASKARTPKKKDNDVQVTGTGGEMGSTDGIVTFRAESQNLKRAFAAAHTAPPTTAPAVAANVNTNADAHTDGFSDIYTGYADAGARNGPPPPPATPAVPTDVNMNEDAHTDGIQDFYADYGYAEDVAGSGLSPHA